MTQNVAYTGHLIHDYHGKSNVKLKFQEETIKLLRFDHRLFSVEILTLRKVNQK